MILVEDGFSWPTAEAHALIASISGESDMFASTMEARFPSPQAFKAHCKHLQRRPGALFLLARDAQGICGFLFLEPSPYVRLSHVADLNLGVLDRVKGQRTGSTLLEGALVRASALCAIEIVQLKVRADNRAAVRLYESTGFNVQAVLEDDTKIGSRYVDGLLMRKALGRGSLAAKLR